MDESDTLGLREGIELLLSNKRIDYTDETLRDYRGRLDRFATWCEHEAGVTTVDGLSGRLFETYKSYLLAEGYAPTTVKGSMATCKVLADYLVSIDAVDESLPHKINIPSLSQDEETSDVMLAAADAEGLVRYYRNSRTQYATKYHVALEVTWHVGPRLGGLRALDVSDVDPERRALVFKHRPPTGLKKKTAGERTVGLRQEVVDVIQTWLDDRHPQVRDDEGRMPLFGTQYGRAAASTLQTWLCHSTIPCHHQACPHDKDPRACTWTRPKESRQCPSSRSPHQIRTGSITWQLNSGLTYEEVAERVNSTPDTLRRYYDKATPDEKFEQRRRHTAEKLAFDGAGDENGG